MKSGSKKGCCVGARSGEGLGFESWLRMVQVAVTTKTPRISAAARQS